MRRINHKNRFEKLWTKYKKYFYPLNLLIKYLGIIALMIILMEIFSGIIISQHKFIDKRADSEVYDQKEWSQNYFKEFGESFETEFYNYVGYKRKPNYFGEYINLDENSLRKTVNNCGEKKIFVFGGSTTWGTGARDERTVPSLLAKNLCSNGEHVKVTNFGESGYVSTQEIIRLQLELQKGNIPEIVIFYDGINDYFSSFQNQKAGAVQNEGNRIREFNGNSRVFLMLKNTNRVLSLLIKQFIIKNTQMPFSDELIQDTKDVYLKNIQIVKALEKQFGFKAFFYWQPAIFTKETLSQEEKEIPNNKILRESYIKLSNNIVLSKDIKDLTKIFNNNPETIYIDQWHTSEEGNAIIAKKIQEDIIKSFGEENEE